jgi:hypothetical protein
MHFDAFFERHFCWDVWEAADKGIIPYQKPWVGFMHNPPNVPKWFDWCNSPECYLPRDITKESLNYCKGIFTLSNYHAEYLGNEIDKMGYDIPVNALIHPTETPEVKFDMDKFRDTEKKRIVMLGWWLRRMWAIRALPTEKYWKTWIVVDQNAKFAFDRENRTIDDFHLQKGIYEEMYWQDNDDFDELLSRSITFLNLYDTSANNAVIESIVRNTPILVNRLPATEEYLGKDYPFLYDTLEEAAEMVDDEANVEAAHQYLVEMDKERFTGEYFLNSFENSFIYKNL